MIRGLLAVALFLAVAAGAWFVLRSDDDLSPTMAEDVDPSQIDTSSIEEMALGPADAPVTVIEYASFTCPHCARFHEEVFPRLRADYIDTGRIRFVHREVFFDRYGLWAGMIARCGGPMRYFGIAELIYARQDGWTQGEDPAAIVDNLRRIGLSAGLTGEQVETCLGDGETAQRLVAWYRKHAEADGIEATPTFVIDGETHGNMSYEALAGIIDSKLDGEG